MAEGHDGPFSRLIDRVGPEMSAHLRSVALGKAAMDFDTLHLETSEQ